MGGVVFMFLFAVIGAIVLVPRYLKSREREQMQATLRAAIERGQPLPPEILAAMTQDVPTAPVRRQKPLPSPQSDLRRAIIWFAVALGIVVLGVMGHWDEGDAIYWGLGLAAIPAIIGLAFVALSVLSRSASKRSPIA
jgi:hypothetical protein